MSSTTNKIGQLQMAEKQEYQNGSRLQSMESLLLGGSATSFTVQDIQDSIVQQTLSETILLQNVNFDSNIFDDVNLDLESNSDNNNDDLKPDAGQSMEQLSMLDNIESQLLKQAQTSNEIVSNSSDPLVTSTTTIYTHRDGPTSSRTSLDFKLFDKTPDSLMNSLIQANSDKTSLVVAHGPQPTTNSNSNKCTGESNELHDSFTQDKSIQKNRVTNATKFMNEKVYLSAKANVATLSLANMKVGSQNVLAVIKDSENKTKKQQLLSESSQLQQPQLILIEDNKDLITETASKTDGPPHNTTDANAKHFTKITPSSSVVKEVKGSNNIASSTSATSGESNQFTDADSNSGAPSSKAFVPCKVCGDKASGYHYGVTSCEGCKGFFRRSIQKQIEYRCLRDGKCLIIRLNRNRCQYCRFKKCLAVGMSRDSVRYGRVPKKSKEKERLDEKSNGVTQAEADQSSTVDIDSKDLALYDTILTISQAHHANCSYTGDKIKGLLKKPIFEIKTSDDCSSSHDVGSVSESLEAKRIELWENLALLITPCIQRVVEFAKRIPGFSDLTQDDQLILIKLGFFEVWLVHISKTADCAENTLTFADGSFLSRKQLELMFDHDFVASIFHLMSGINNLKLNDTEIGLFAAIILLQSDRPQIYDVKAINKNQEMIVEALKVQINRYHNDDLQTFQNLMVKINELRGLGSSHALHLQWYRSNWSRLKLPPLFAEIFDIPKSSLFGASTVHGSSAVPQSSSSLQIEPASSSETNTPTASNLALPLDDSNLI